MRAVPLVLFSMACGGGYAGPNCKDVRHSFVFVDTTGELPLFDWDGDQPNGLAVLDETGAAVWEVLCECEANADEVGGEIECKDRVDREFLACVPAPVTYGTLPDVASVSREDGIKWEADPLVPGDTYTVLIWTLCSKAQLSQSTDFVVPVPLPGE